MPYKNISRLNMFLESMIVEEEDLFDMVEDISMELCEDDGDYSNIILKYKDRVPHREIKELAEKFIHSLKNKFGISDISYVSHQRTADGVTFKFRTSTDDANTLSNWYNKHRREDLPIEIDKEHDKELKSEKTPKEVFHRDPEYADLRERLGVKTMRALMSTKGDLVDVAKIRNAEVPLTRNNIKEVLS